MTEEFYALMLPLPAPSWEDSAGNGSFLQNIQTVF